MDAVAKTDEVHRFELTQISSASYAGLVLLNVLLNIVTLTLYRFWGKTAIRRRLWAETSLAGESFEYAGRGMELFIGFLIATVTVFLPIVLTLSAAQIFLAPRELILVLMPIYALIGLLAFVAVFMARRYQLSRTIWRGIRFGMDGSPWAFAFFALGQVLFCVITLGWWAPAARQRIARRLWRGARCGDTAFGFGRDEGERLAGVTYVYFAFGWVAIVAALVAGGVLLAEPFTRFAELMRDPASAESTELGILALGLYGGFWGLILIVALAFLPYQTAGMRRTAALLTFGDTRFALRMNSLGLLWLVISNFLLVVFTLGLLAPLTQIRGWRYVVGRLEAHGPMTLAQVVQSASQGPRSGEGLADGLDFGGV
jgi:uncharacterized membrane protein YjgN (DUF898 family)